MSGPVLGAEGKTASVPSEETRETSGHCSHLCLEILFSKDEGGEQEPSPVLLAAHSYTRDFNILFLSNTKEIILLLPIISIPLEYVAMCLS